MEEFIRLQIGNDAMALPDENKIQLLKARFKRLIIMLVVNIGIVVFFGYSFYYEITTLSDTWYTFIVVFFVMNVIFITYHWKKLRQSIDYLESGG